MLPQDRNEERRDGRRHDPLVSLARLFEAAKRRAGLDTIVLADDAGLAIAGAGASSTCDELAARAALLSSHPANDTVPCRLDVVARAMEVRRLRIDGIEVFLCAEGTTSISSEELSSVARGCERILAGRRAAGTRGAGEGEKV